MSPGGAIPPAPRVAGAWRRRPARRRGLRRRIADAPPVPRWPRRSAAQASPGPAPGAAGAWQAARRAGIGPEPPTAPGGPWPGPEALPAWRGRAPRLPGWRQGGMRPGPGVGPPLDGSTVSLHHTGAASWHLCDDLGRVVAVRPAQLAADLSPIALLVLDSRLAWLPSGEGLGPAIARYAVRHCRHTLALWRQDTPERRTEGGTPGYPEAAGPWDGHGTARPQGTERSDQSRGIW